MLTARLRWALKVVGNLVADFSTGAHPPNPLVPPARPAEAGLGERQASLFRRLAIE